MPIPKIDPLVIVVSRQEVERDDISRPLGILKRFTESADTARSYFERVDIAFHGYDEDSQELFAIPEVRNFVYRLDSEFPFWLFFLSKHYLGLQCLLYCFLPPFLTDEARKSVHAERISQLLTNRWFPAMNAMCEVAGFSEKEIERLSNRVVQYVTKVKLPIGSTKGRFIERLWQRWPWRR